MSVLPALDYEIAEIFLGVATDHRQGGLDRDRVARQAKQVAAEAEELEVELAGRCEVARVKGLAERLHVGRHEVADDADHAAAADGEQRQRHAVVAGKNGEVGGADDLRAEA